MVRARTGPGRSQYLRWTVIDRLATCLSPTTPIHLPTHLERGLTFYVGGIGEEVTMNPVGGADDIILVIKHTSGYSVMLGSGEE